jgi:hypothetical protein
MMRALSYPFIAGLAFAVGAGSLHAQIRRQPAQAQTAPVEIALQVGAKRYEFSGQGECKAAPQASIYGINAALYSVSHSAGGRRLNLTLWQPKNGSAEMMTLHVSDGSSRYEVDTVKAGAKRETKGSGKTTLQKSGAGGIFTIAAVAGSGEKISGTIKCGRFAGIQAEGG